VAAPVGRAHLRYRALIAFQCGLSCRLGDAARQPVIA
jgi:hypothetical protein